MRIPSVMGCCLAVLLSLNLEAREWKFVDGTVLEADLFGFNDSCVTLKSAPETTVDYPLATLSREDRTYARQQWRKLLGPAPLTNTASMRWHFDGSDRPQHPMLSVNLTTHGEIIANAGRVGELQIETIETDAPAPPKLPDLWNYSGSELGAADRGADDYPYTLWYSMSFDFNGQPLTRIRRLKGSYKIETGDRHTIVIKNIARAKNVAVNDPILGQLKLKMIANASNPLEYAEPEAGTQCFTLDIYGPRGKVLDVSWTDSEGSPCKATESSGGTYSNGDDPSESTESYLSRFEQPIARDLELRITVLTNPREERVPFDLADLVVPPPPPAPERVPSVLPEAAVEKVSPPAKTAAPQTSQANLRTKKAVAAKRNRRRFR